MDSGNVDVVFSYWGWKHSCTVDTAAGKTDEQRSDWAEFSTYDPPGLGRVSHHVTMAHSYVSKILHSPSIDMVNGFSCELYL